MEDKNVVQLKFGTMLYKVPHLPISVMKVVVPLVYAMRKVEAEGGDTMEAMLTIIQVGLGHVCGMTREQLESMTVTMEEVRDAVATISVQCGLRMGNDSSATLDAINGEGGAPLELPSPSAQTSTE